MHIGGAVYSACSLVCPLGTLHYFLPFYSDIKETQSRSRPIENSTKLAILLWCHLLLFAITQGKSPAFSSEYHKWL